MKKLGFLLKREFLQIFRNKFLLRLVLIMPVMQLAILPWAATFDQRDISLAVVDNDKSSVSTKMIDKILSSGFFKLSDYSPTYDDALHSIEQGNSDLILEIPHSFEKEAINGQPVELMLSLDAVNGQKAGLGLSYISQIITSYASDINSDIYKVPIVEVKPYYRYNTRMSYQDYMVPGILVVLVSMMGGMLSSLNIVREKEIGTMEQINVTPVSKVTFILGKIIPFWIIGLVILTLGMLIAWIIYGLYPVGHVMNIYIFAFVYLLAFTGLGLMISNFAQTQQQAMFVILFFLIIFILISGLFTPVTSMPDWAQKITYINPLRYFVEVMRLIYLKGSGFMDILPNLIKIFVFAVVFNLLAILTYKKVS